MIEKYGGNPEFKVTLEGFRTLLQRVWNLEEPDFNMNFPEKLKPNELLGVLTTTFQIYNQEVSHFVKEYKKTEQREVITDEEMFELMKKVDLNVIKDRVYREMEYPVIDDHDMIINAQIHYYLTDSSFAASMIAIQDEHRKHFEKLKNPSV